VDKQDCVCIHVGSVCIPFDRTDGQHTPVSLSGVIVYRLHHNAMQHHLSTNQNTQPGKKSGCMMAGARLAPQLPWCWPCAASRRPSPTTHRNPHHKLSLAGGPFTLALIHRLAALHQTTNMGVRHAVCHWQTSRHGVHQHHHQRMRPKAAQKCVRA
jgi:hypothetical protein